MMDLTIGYTYFNKPSSIAFLKKWYDTHNLHARGIIVDDGSTVPLTLNQIPKGWDLYRVTKDVGWNDGGCRNLIAHVATTKWLLLFDMDVFVLPNTIQLLNTGHFDWLSPRHLYWVHKTTSYLSMKTREESYDWYAKYNPFNLCRHTIPSGNSIWKHPLHLAHWNEDYPTPGPSDKWNIKSCNYHPGNHDFIHNQILISKELFDSSPGYPPRKYGSDGPFCDHFPRTHKLMLRDFEVGHNKWGTVSKWNQQKVDERFTSQEISNMVYDERLDFPWVKITD